MSVRVGEFTVAIHTAERLYVVSYGFPIIANDFIALLCYRIFFFPAADVTVKCPRFHSGGLQQGGLRTGGHDKEERYRISPGDCATAGHTNGVGRFRAALSQDDERQTGGVPKNALSPHRAPASAALCNLLPVTTRQPQSTAKARNGIAMIKAKAAKAPRRLFLVSRSGHRIAFYSRSRVQTARLSPIPLLIPMETDMS